MSITEESVARLAEAGRVASDAKRKGKLESGGVAPTYEGDFVLESHLALECGRTLIKPVLHYAVYGRLNAARDNAVLVCHALSGSALVGAWWPGLFGDPASVEPTSQKRDVGRPDFNEGARKKQILRCAQDDNSVRENSSDPERSSAGIVDLERDCVICVNLLGSCYGSTGPGSVNPEKLDSGRPDEISLYGPEFPLVSIRDNVRAQAELIQALGIARLKLAIGGSIGGMQALEWSILYPERVKRAVVIGVAPLNAMGLALNHLQRRAIQNDPDWREGWYLPHQQPRRGLALARQIAMLSYKSPELFEERFGRNPNRNGEDPWGLDRDGGGLSVDAGRFDVAGFLDYQGERFPERFDANAYLAILRMMDTWDPGRGRRSAAEAFGRIEAQVMFVGISSDALFPSAEVKALAEAARGAGVHAEYREMVTGHGHDAFLAEQGELVRVLGGTER
ncbi:MAG TPA: homoserine O-acetyltransferase [Acidobacteriaceae bacterium]